MVIVPRYAGSANATMLAPRGLLKLTGLALNSGMVENAVIRVEEQVLVETLSVYL